MLIDPRIRDAVLLPLLVFVMFATLLRFKLFNLFSNPSQKTEDKIQLQQKAVVQRSQRLRTVGGYITPRGFAQRLVSINRELEQPTTDVAPDMMSQFDTMKIQMVNQVVYLGLFYAIQNALAGFLVVKLPFSLTERFKQLTQQGIGIPSLDTSFVSSGSWYMIAQNGVNRLIELLGAAGSMPDEATIMQMQMGMMPGMMGGNQQFMAGQAFKQEKAALEVCHYNSALLRTEREMLSAAKKLRRA